MDLSNVEKIVIICGVQFVCKGSEATGDVAFGEDITIPCCYECYQELQRIQDETEETQQKQWPSDVQQGTGF